MEIAILLYPRFTALDAIGPMEVLSSMHGAHVQLVAEQVELVTNDTGGWCSEAQQNEYTLAVLYQDIRNLGMIFGISDRATATLSPDRRGAPASRRPRPSPAHTSPAAGWFLVYPQWPVRQGRRGKCAQQVVEHGTRARGHGIALRIGGRAAHGGKQQPGAIGREARHTKRVEGLIGEQRLERPVGAAQRQRQRVALAVDQDSRELPD
jgi:hypothetical protein